MKDEKGKISHANGQLFDLYILFLLLGRARLRIRHVGAYAG